MDYVDMYFTVLGTYSPTECLTPVGTHWCCEAWESMAMPLLVAPNGDGAP